MHEFIQKRRKSYLRHRLKVYFIICTILFSFVVPLDFTQAASKMADPANKAGFI